MKQSTELITIALSNYRVASAEAEAGLGADNIPLCGPVKSIPKGEALTRWTTQVFILITTSLHYEVVYLEYLVVAIPKG